MGITDGHRVDRLTALGARAGRRGVELIRDATGFGEIIYLIAPAGHPNYGDELIARAWLAHLAVARPRATVVVDCHSPGQAALLLRGVHANAVFVNTLWELTFAAHAAGPDDPAHDSLTAGAGAPPWEQVADAACRLGVTPRLAEGVDLLSRASTIHFVGGGYLNRIWTHHASLFIAAARVAERSGARIVATGQGLLPLVEEPVWTPLAQAITSFTVFDLRDRESHDVVAAIDPASSVAVGMSGDDAWLAVGRPKARDARLLARGGPPNRARDGVILCLQGDLTDDFECNGLTGTAALADFVTRTLDAWGVPSDAVTVVEGIPGVDNEVPTLMGDRLRGATVVPHLNVWRNGLPAGHGQTWISTRFHPHLVAAAAGDPGLAIATKNGYYSIKHGLLADAGSRWTTLSDPTVEPHRPTAGGFSAADRDHAVAKKTALAHTLYPRRLGRGRFSRS